MSNKNVGARPKQPQSEESILPEYQKIWIQNNVYCLPHEVATILLDAVDNNKISCKNVFQATYVEAQELASKFYKAFEMARSKKPMSSSRKVSSVMVYDRDSGTMYYPETPP